MGFNTKHHIAKDLKKRIADCEVELIQLRNAEDNLKNLKGKYIFHIQIDSLWHDEGEPNIEYTSEDYEGIERAVVASVDSFENATQRRDLEIKWRVFVRLGLVSVPLIHKSIDQLFRDQKR